MTKFKLRIKVVAAFCVTLVFATAAILQTNLFDPPDEKPVGDQVVPNVEPKVDVVELPDQPSAVGAVSTTDSSRLPNNKQALLDNPFRSEPDLDYARLNELPKHDRPDLAMRQYMEMTADPNDQQIHPERAVAAFREAKRIMSTDAYARNVDLTETVWTERGPTNVGGRTRALAFDPNDPSLKKVWAGGVSGGLWFTENIYDANAPWQNVDDFWANLAITGIAFDPSNPQTIYISTGEGYQTLNAVRGEGIWKSTDGGGSWQQLSSTYNQPEFHIIHDIVVLDNGAVLAATLNDGVMRSLDGGSTWANVLSEGATTRASDLEVASNGHIYATTGVHSTGNIWKSIDGGTTWTDILPAEHSDVQRIEVAVAPSNPDIIYAIMQEKMFWSVRNDLGGGIIKSIDGGANWQWLPNPVDQDVYMIDSLDFTNGQGWYNLIAQVDPNDPNHVLVGGIDLFQSFNGGNTWSQISKQNNAAAIAHLDLPVVHADQHAIVFKPGSSAEAIFGNDGGVYLGTDLLAGQAENQSEDIDGDGRLNGEDLDPNNRFICGDTDGDGCDDCTTGVFNALDDGIDTDGDGICNDGDEDDDNDGILDTNDPNPLNELICGDSDGDGCDDCSNGSFNPDNDGADNDNDGICDNGDDDDDNDGVLDTNDLDPLNAFICGDSDGDGCDDCSNGSFDVNNDGIDTDADGICNTGDDDDDNDGVLDVNDINPLNPLICGDSDGDTLRRLRQWLI